MGRVAQLDTQLYTSIPSRHTFSSTSQLLRVYHLCVVVSRVFGGGGREVLYLRTIIHTHPSSMRFW